MAISDAINILTSRPPEDPIDTLKRIARFGRSFELLIEAFGQDKQMEVTAALGAVIDFLSMLVPDDSAEGGDLKTAVENGVIEGVTEMLTDPFGLLSDILAILGAVNGLMGAEIPLFNYILEFGNIMVEGIQQGGGPDTGGAPFYMPEEGSPADNAASMFDMDDNGGGDDGGGDISDILSADADWDSELDITEPDITNPTEITQEGFNSLWDTIKNLDEDSISPEQSQQLDELVGELLDEFGTEDDIYNLFGSN